MSQISAKDVKDLRDTTGVGMMECKKALEETGGDMQKAIEYLRKKGAAMAAKRADREASEGMICIRLSDDQKNGVILELNCETDFVARGEVFTGFASELAGLALANNCESRDALLAINLGEAYGNESVEEALKSMTGKVGEKLELKRLARLSAEAGVLESYIHPGAQLAALIAVDTDKPEETRALAKDLAMQVAAAAPIVTDRSFVPAEYVEKEKEIYRQQALAQGKKEEFVDKIVMGRLDKYYQEVVLTEQTFIKDQNARVSGVLDDFMKKNQAQVKVKAFVRYQLGA
ncbi:translation elongation factor Ts [Chlorobaculum limnaeum]|uniref:Elongation factor Ts n=1 Tax=Chlorobaculum limnaeum TaxID=274537 RepID=A0A1D8D424_CHLLM|nr:translation elongation factor Ts [Chlorobaculum limnaeum]AOS83034.1 translation elongation factor Ts [Chlorobaculum limnaeum]